MQAKSFRVNSPEAIKTALEQSLADGYQPTLAFVFIAIKQDSDAVSKLLDQKGISGSDYREPILRANESVTGPETIIWGGLAGDDFIFNQTIVFPNEQPLIKGILLLVMDGDKILVRGQAASGQKAVGTEKTITKTIGNWVHEIDNQPAAQMFMKYLGLILTEAEAETFNPVDNNIVFSVLRSQGDLVLRGAGIINRKQ